MGERRMGLRRRLWVVGLAILTLYLVQLVNMLGLLGDLTRFGIRPRELSSLASIPVAPFIHEGFGHLAANTVPLFALGFLVCFRSLGSLAFVTLAVTLVSGLATWFLGRGGPQVGADGLVFGYFGFLLTAAVVERSPRSLLVAAITVALYGSLLWGVLPTQAHASWEGHLFGCGAGILAGRYGPMGSPRVRDGRSEEPS